jgi:hypothetical protein
MGCPAENWLLEQLMSLVKEHTALLTQNNQMRFYFNEIWSSTNLSLMELNAWMAWCLFFLFEHH